MKRGKHKESAERDIETRRNRRQPTKNRQIKHIHRIEKKNVPQLDETRENKLNNKLTTEKDKNAATDKNSCCFGDELKNQSDEE